MAISEDYSAASPRKSSLLEKKKYKQDSVKLNLQKSIDDCVDALNYDKMLAEMPSKRHRYVPRKLSTSYFNLKRFIYGVQILLIHYGYNQHCYKLLFERHGI